MNRKILSGLITLLFAFVLTSTDTHALELVVSGNGSGSDNEVQVEVEQEQTVEQTNEASVENEVNTEANTGDNEASGNTGEETNITTGDIQNQVEVANEVNSSSIQTQNCCQENTSLVVEGNGTDSENSINLSESQVTNVEVFQEANINNTINGNSNTGTNTANNNNGNVSIKTGDIQGEVSVSNSANQSSIDVGAPGQSDISVLIKGNGSSSDNHISLELINLTNIERINTANINNNIFWNANTGLNSANGNSGDVYIKTGNIFFGINVKNGPINTGSVSVGGCCEDPADPFDPPTPTPPPAPPTPGGNGQGGNDGGNSGGNGNSGNSNGNGNNGESKGDVLGIGGGILPATGGDWLLLALIANIATFLMGLYLRLRSGRSPNA